MATDIARTCQSSIRGGKSQIHRSRIGKTVSFPTLPPAFRGRPRFHRLCRIDQAAIVATSSRDRDSPSLTCPSERTSTYLTRATWAKTPNLSSAVISSMHSTFRELSSRDFSNGHHEHRPVWPASRWFFRPRHRIPVAAQLLDKSLKLKRGGAPWVQRPIPLLF